jgi:hypothetical protein
MLLKKHALQPYQTNNNNDSNNHNNNNSIYLCLGETRKNNSIVSTVL